MRADPYHAALSSAPPLLSTSPPPVRPHGAAHTVPYYGRTAICTKALHDMAALLHSAHRTSCALRHQAAGNSGACRPLTLPTAASHHTLIHTGMPAPCYVPPTHAVGLLKEIQVSYIIVILGISLFVLGFALGPLIWAPLQREASICTLPASICVSCRMHMRPMIHKLR